MDGKRFTHPDYEKISNVTLPQLEFSQPNQCHSFAPHAPACPFSRNNIADTSNYPYYPPNAGANEQIIDRTSELVLLPSLRHMALCSFVVSGQASFTYQHPPLRIPSPAPPFEGYADFRYVQHQRPVQWGHVTPRSRSSVIDCTLSSAYPGKDTHRTGKQPETPKTTFDRPCGNQEVSAVKNHRKRKSGIEEKIFADGCSASGLSSRVVYARLNRSRRKRYMVEMYKYRASMKSRNAEKRRNLEKVQTESSQLTQEVQMLRSRLASKCELMDLLTTFHARNATSSSAASACRIPTE